jgi:hypothetical protein
MLPWLCSNFLRALLRPNSRPEKGCYCTVVAQMRSSVISRVMCMVGVYAQQTRCSLSISFPILYFGSIKIPYACMMKKVSVQKNKIRMNFFL